MAAADTALPDGYARRLLAKPIEYEAEASTRLYDARLGHQSLDVCSGQLSVVEGPDAGRALALGPTTLRIGTAAGSHLRLSDPTVSRVHCQVTPRRDGFRLSDSGSTNGTFVDGVRVRDADLLRGALVRIGATALRFELGSEPVRLALSKANTFGALLGGSTEMRRLYAILESVSPTNATILIQGETGTGKELVAQEVHRHSNRASRPFVAVDCGAIAPNVIESELFGHVRGAFSGAVGDRRGLIEEADGGSLFLDEIGELPLALQAKLLRALENREVRRVGSNQSRQVDVRLLAATNRSLAQSVNEGSFREDLYYRLAVVEVVLPPLRTRRDDIGMLAQHFFERFSATREPLPASLVASLVVRSWVGNIRELRNFVERWVALGKPQSDGPSEASSATAASTALAVRLDLPLKGARDEVLERFERLYVESALRQESGNVTRAAQRSGVSRRFLQRLIARLDIRGASSEPDDADDGADALEEE